MKEQRINRYRMPVSRTFPQRHPKAGKETLFVDKISVLKGIIQQSTYVNVHGEYAPKLHTIRANYSYWAERIEKVQRGEAVIELYYWDGRPYNSKQVVFATLDRDSGCGVQKLYFGQSNINEPIVNEESWYKGYQLDTIAINDGLSLEDFKAWFKGYDLSGQMAIIHFTSFRY